MEWNLVAAKRTCWTLCVCIAQWLLADVAVAQNVAIIMSENTAPYFELADAIKRKVNQQVATKLKLITMPAEDLVSGENEIYKTAFYSLVVTLGAHAAIVVAKIPVKPPILHTLIPRFLYEQLPLRTLGQQTSAIYLDQPVARQLELIRLVLPNKRRLGVVFGPKSTGARTDLERVALSKGYVIVAENLDPIGDFGSALARILKRADFLVALPDADVYNRTTIPKILLSSYHANRPVFSYSAAHVKAGALAAVFTPPESLAQQIADLIVKQQASVRVVLPPPQYPIYWSVSINRQVARSLRLNVTSDQEIKFHLSEISEEQ